MVSNHIMLIGDIAKLSDVTPGTIRYYEELGLLTQPRRSDSGYRHYCATAIEELRFIKKGQGLGFSLEEIGEILKISRAGEARIRDLQAFRDRLAGQIARWKDRSMTTCNTGGLCEIITSADLPAKLIP